MTTPVLELFLSFLGSAYTAHGNHRGNPVIFFIFFAAAGILMLILFLRSKR